VIQVQVDPAEGPANTTGNFVSNHIAMSASNRHTQLLFCKFPRENHYVLWELFQCLNLHISNAISQKSKALELKGSV
jgi:hypothetical protein